MLQEDLLGSWNGESNLSIVIVRHPMSRLASVYYQKFIELSNNKAWANVGIIILLLQPFLFLPMILEFLIISDNFPHHCKVQARRWCWAP